MTDALFQNHLNVDSFVLTPTHDEAYSRAMYVVEQHRRTGLIVGAAGTGKSMILRLLQRDLSRKRHRVVSIDATGIDTSEFVWELSSRLQMAPRETSGTAGLWRRLEDELSGNDLGHRPVVILVDGVSDSVNCQSGIARLIGLQAKLRGWMSIILTCRDNTFRIFDRQLAEICEIQATIVPLDVISLKDYVNAIASRDSESLIQFGDEAVEQLHLRCGGIPRLVNRVCDFARLLAMDLRTKIVDADMIDLACQQFSLLEADSDTSQESSLEVSVF